MKKTLLLGILSLTYLSVDNNVCVCVCVCDCEQSNQRNILIFLIPSF